MATMTLEDARAREEASRLEWERSTYVAEINGQRFTIADLRETFDAVCDKTDWKAPWAAKVPHQLVTLVIEAVKFFHADVATCDGIEPITGRVIMSGRGYQAD